MKIKILRNGGFGTPVINLDPETPEEATLLGRLARLSHNPAYRFTMGAVFDGDKCERATVGAWKKID